MAREDLLHGYKYTRNGYEEAMNLLCDKIHKKDKAVKDPGDKAIRALQRAYDKVRRSNRASLELAAHFQTILESLAYGDPREPGKERKEPKPDTEKA